MSQQAKTSSDNASMLSARLSAVQALYQMMLNKQPIKQVAKEYIEHRGGMEIEGKKLAKPDVALFKTILYGVDERLIELEAIVQANYKNEKSEASRVIEPLLKSILLCGTYELLARQDIDSPIIINDYLNVTHSFYEQGEVSLVNGMLDAISTILRS